MDRLEAEPQVRWSFPRFTPQKVLKMSPSRPRLMMEEAPGELSSRSIYEKVLQRNGSALIYVEERRPIEPIVQKHSRITPIRKYEAGAKLVEVAVNTKEPNPSESFVLSDIEDDDH